MLSFKTAFEYLYEFTKFPIFRPILDCAASDANSDSIETRCESNSIMVFIICSWSSVMRPKPYCFKGSNIL